MHIVLIYDTFIDSEFHKKARSLLDSLDRWYIPPTVLQEYVWFFRSQGFSSRDAKIMLSEYIRSKLTFSKGKTSLCHSLMI